MNDFLHDSLPLGFKIILAGKDFPVHFMCGDKLSISNTCPEDDDYTLIKRQGRHRVELHSELNQGEFNASEIIGPIMSFERSCNPSCELFLGDDPDHHHAPGACRECSQLEVIEMAGRVVAYCYSESGLVKCNPENAGCCTRNSSSKKTSW
jgi:hypothetical protein